MVIEFDLKDIALVSTNEMYMPRPCRGGRSAYLTKTPEMREFEEKIKDILDEELSEEIVNKLHEELSDPNIAMKLHLHSLLPSASFFKVDTSNVVKALEDCIKIKIDVDDTRNCEVLSTKELSDNFSTHVTMETYKLGFEIPEDKWPKKVKKGK